MHYLKSSFVFLLITNFSLAQETKPDSIIKPVIIKADTIIPEKTQLQLVKSEPDINLDSLMKATEEKKAEYIYATFKGTKIINGQSIETPGKGVLQLMFQHRFGPVNNTFNDFFGLDQASIRIGLDYGITNRLAVGIGRNKTQKAYDAYFKFKILRQCTGENPCPISITLFQSAAINTLDENQWLDTLVPYRIEYRMYYTSQLLIARKFNESLSLQLMPTLIHRNLVEKRADRNTIFALGIGTRVKISKRTAIVAEYYYVFPDQLNPDYYHATLSLGFDIETGGHVFQVHFTSANDMTEHQFIGMNKNNLEFGARSIRLGFNLNRVFTLFKKKKS